MVYHLHREQVIDEQGKRQIKGVCGANLCFCVYSRIKKEERAMGVYVYGVLEKYLSIIW